MALSKLRILAMVLPLFFLVGCINLLPKDESSFEQITLDNLTQAADFAQLLPVNWQLAVESPTTGGYYNTDKIVVLVNTYDYTYAVGVRWIDELAALLQHKVIRAFEDSGKIKGVGPISSGMNPKFILTLVVRKFQIDVDIPKKPTVAITLGAKLLDLRTRRIVDYILIESTEIMKSPSLLHTTQAFNGAFSSAMKQLITWTLDR